MPLGELTVVLVRVVRQPGYGAEPQRVRVPTALDRDDVERIARRMRPPVGRTRDAVLGLAAELFQHPHRAGSEAAFAQ